MQCSDHQVEIELHTKEHRGGVKCKKADRGSARCGNLLEHNERIRNAMRLVPILGTIPLLSQSFVAERMQICGMR